MFKIGQKVVCVQTAKLEVVQLALSRGCELPIKDCIYTVTQNLVIFGMAGVQVAELNSGVLPGYACDWFAPIDETFADDVLENIKKQINEDELVRI